MTKKKLSTIRRIQKKALDSGAVASGAASLVFRKTGEQLRKLDEEFSLTTMMREQGGRVRDKAKDIDQEYSLSEKAAMVGREASILAGRGKDAVDRAADKAGVYKASNAAKDIVTEYFADPAVAISKRCELDKRLEIIGGACEELYGKSRRVIKPYFSPETAEELLQNTRKELAYISACIMQISPGEAEKIATQFGSVVASKIAGIAASGTLLTLVSTFGTAGTGTAIASLSGAASASATLAWVGGLLGGGMATGAVLTGGVGIVVGLGAYKALSSTRRDFDDLDEVEQRIVQYCWMLIAIVDDYLENEDRQFGVDGAHSLLVDTLLPLQSLLIENSGSICRNLDKKDALAFRQHVLKDFDPAIINPITEFVASGLETRALHYEYVIGGAIYALMTRSAVDDSMESQLVLDALRRSDPDLANASEAELSVYLDDYNPEQLKGIANNVKGIYHEQLWVEQYNANHETTRAEMFGTTNHAGSDVRIIDVNAGEVVAEYQLKATDNVAYINEHLVKYPNVNVIATNEVVARMDGVKASGNLNADLSDTVDSDIDALAGYSIDDRVLVGGGLAATVATGQELIEMLQGRRAFPEAVAAVVRKTGTAGAATAIAAYLFS